MRITLARVELDNKNVGYQEPEPSEPVVPKEEKKVVPKEEKKTEPKKKQQERPQ